MPTVLVVDRRVGERRAQARPPVRLLLVDDHPMFVASLHRVLEEEPDISVVAGGRQDDDLADRADRMQRRHVPNAQAVGQALVEQDDVRSLRGALPLCLGERPGVV